MSPIKFEPRNQPDWILIPTHVQPIVTILSLVYNPLEAVQSDAVSPLNPGTLQKHRKSRRSGTWRTTLCTSSTLSKLPLLEEL